MSDSTQVKVLSEMERLEFNRRLDIADAVVHDAVRVFCKTTELDKLIELKSKSANGMVYLLVILAGFALDYFLPDSGGRISFGGFLAFILIAIFAWKYFEIQYLQSRRDHYNERLYELEVIWAGATGINTFWAIGNFAHLIEHDRHNAQFQNWWSEQSAQILERVQLDISPV